MVAEDPGFLDEQRALYQSMCSARDIHRGQGAAPPTSDVGGVLTSSSKEDLGGDAFGCGRDHAHH